MKVVVTGGGSGGHITPLLAVAAELKKLHPESTITYIGQTGDRFVRVVREHNTIDSVYTIRAGKFRRYHGEGWKQLLDIKTMLFNVRDAVMFAIGCVQSVVLLGRLRPDVIFIKGGFVGVPVGLAAALMRIPYITHDSDAIAGLANKIIAKWAVCHAVALPKETYRYPAVKTITVGVPIADVYHPLNSSEIKEYKERFAIPKEAQVILVTGGGLGAQRINTAMVAITPSMLRAQSLLYIVHTTGHVHHKEIVDAYDAALDTDRRRRVIVLDYTPELYAYSAVADVVIARAGATNMAELAMQQKATIIIPNPVLAGGHQLKNAEAYERADAAVVVTEADLEQSPESLQEAALSLLRDDRKRQSLGAALARFAHPDSARLLAKLLVQYSRSK